MSNTQLSTQELQNRITSLPWTVSAGEFRGGEKFLQIISESCDVAIADMCVTDGYAPAEAELITTAVNFTYGKGYDPAKMDDCVKMLQHVLGEPNLAKHVAQDICKLLESAKLK